jgi:hypothetical protein
MFSARVGMICADFLARVNLENGNPNALLLALDRLLGPLPPPQRQLFVQLARKASRTYTSVSVQGGGLMRSATNSSSANAAA